MARCSKDRSAHLTPQGFGAMIREQGFLQFAYAARSQDALTLAQRGYSHFLCVLGAEGSDEHGGMGGLAEVERKIVGAIFLLTRHASSHLSKEGAFKSV